MRAWSDERYKADTSASVPEFTGEWQEKRLGEVFDAARGSSLSWGDIEADGKNKAILYGQLYTIYPEVVSQVVSRTNSNKGTPSKNGDLLLPNSTTTTGIDLANATALNEDGVLLGGDITILRFKETGSSIFYAYYLSHFMKYKLAAYGQGSTIVHMYFSQYKNMKIVEPSVAEQQKIAVFLAAVDKRVALLERKVQQLEAYKHGVMQQLFSQQLRFTRPDGSQFPVWREKRLGEIGKFYRGLSYDKSNVGLSGNLVLRSSNIQDGQLILDQDLQFVDKAIGKDQNLSKGDIVICMANGSKKLVGKAAIYKGQYSGGITVGAFCSIFRSNNMLAEYLLQARQYKKYLNMLLAGTNINNLKNSDLEKLKFILPSSEEEQQKIAAFLSAIDEKITLTRQQLDKTKQFKKGLLQRMFV